MIKITFLGDIMCEEPLLKASRRGKDYDFRPVFSGCKELLTRSDYVVGNLETVLAGEKAGYTRELFSFNTPDEWAETMAEAGIDLVTLATNHALDRDKDGLRRTLDTLDRNGIGHIGAYRTEEERNHIFVRRFDGQQIAFLNYTYGTNLNESPFVVDEKEYYLLNLLMPQKRVVSKAKKGLPGRISKILYKTIPLKTILKFKKALGREHVNQYEDRQDPSLIRESYLKRLENDVRKAKEEADVVVVCLHIGGQFNETPGEQVRFFTERFAEWGADYLINTHPHVVQKCERINGAVVANCLGNFSISPSSVYIPHKLKPEYSVAMHLYLDGKEQKQTFSVLKITEDRHHRIKVLPANVLASGLTGADLEMLKQDVTFVYNRFLGREEKMVPVQEEYLIEV